MSAPLKLMTSRMSPRPSDAINTPGSSPGSFYRRLFSYIGPLTYIGQCIGPYNYKTSAFVTGKCRLKVKSAGETCQDGVKMAYWCRILDMRIGGQVFTRVGLSITVPVLISKFPRQFWPMIPVSQGFRPPTDLAPHRAISLGISPPSRDIVLPWF